MVRSDESRQARTGKVRTRHGLERIKVSNSTIPPDVFMRSLLKSALEHKISVAAFCAWAQDDGKAILKLMSNVNKEATEGILAHVTGLNVQAAAEALREELIKRGLDKIGSRGMDVTCIEIVTVVLEAARAHQPKPIDPNRIVV